MFGLEQENLQALWRITLSSASWKSNLSFEQNTEYLRLKQPFSQGYWVNKPDTTGTVSITVVLSLPLFWYYDRSQPAPTVAGRILQLQIACMCLSLNLWNIAANRVFRGWSISPCIYELFAPTT